ncbi:D-alanyl-D-alanine carboxypeptidase [Herbaspirillum rubrisubalbicans]|uniref:D-alanyl-D-alanine carboxypeptidase n=1 Tax=Herbaspirillum rubrisubalbicans TaxID=80842 RepID=A0ABX9C060_9BURK|nr:serine hydrolase [Herbaspirillum rubrisubalbicans]RAM63710.1 D-alanyl-D-alanine carboxypeptidase [Herbaspirillum rubrisubalbicans]RAN44829.1 D-alanyl-D-alanine carboxypeptidase [Herbaspirillum rubrisubalbicans]
MFCTQQSRSGNDFPFFLLILRRAGLLTRLLLCSVLLLMLSVISGKTSQAQAATSTAGKHRAVATGVKGRKRNLRKKTPVQSKARAPSHPRRHGRGRAHGAATAAAGVSAAGATAAAVTAAAAEANAKTATAVATNTKPELLPRCGFTEASRRHLFSRGIYVLDEQTNTPLFERDADTVAPIASVTKLMTAMVWLDQKPLPLANRLEVSEDDLDTLKFTHSRLNVGASLSRADMLHIALMSSENRAAAAMSRDYPGGRPAFIAAMNARAQALGMSHTHFENATGLSPENVSTPRELAEMVKAANRYQLIRNDSLDKQKMINIGRGQLQYINSNRLIRYGQVNATVQKTGFINESGHNMVLRLLVHDRRPVIVTMLGSGSADGSRLDGVRIAKWLNCSLN